MREARPLAFAKPPVWELGIAAGFGSPFMNMYDIKDVHGLFADRFPKPERQPNFTVLEPFPAPGSIAPSPAVAQIVPLAQTTDLTRWWFVSEAGTDLIQVQEDFLARNWRRLTPPPSEVSYPHFDGVFEDFRGIVARLREWTKERGQSLPEPNIVELLYDNLIPLERSDGTKIKFGEVLKPVRFDPPIKTAGFQINWLQYVNEEADEREPLDLQVQIARVGLAISSPSRMYAKLTFRARRAVRSWDAGFGFMVNAHAVLRDLLVELTTEECRATWE